MSSIKIRSFGGLKTFIDPADIDNGYFNTFENLRPRIGYAEAKSLNATEDTFLGEISPPGKLILFDYVFLDEDRQRNKYEDGEFNYDYVQNIEKYKIVIIYAYDGYYIWLYNSEVFPDGRQFVGFHQSSDVEQYPYLINERGIVKILFKEKSYWLGKINRIRWTTEQYYKIESNFYLLPLVYGLDNRAFINFKKFTADDAGYIQSGVPKNISSWTRDIGEHYNGEYKEQYRIKFYDENNEFIRVGIASGFFWVLQVQLIRDWGTGHQLEWGYIISREEASKFGDIEGIFINPENYGATLEPDKNGGFGIYNVVPPIGVRGFLRIEEEFYFFRHESSGYPQPLETCTAFTNYLNALKTFVEVVRTKDAGITPDNEYLEFIMTARIESNEFPIAFFTHKVVESNPNLIDKAYALRLDVLLDEFYPNIRTESVVFYVRYGTGKDDVQSKDFEQFGTIPLLSKLKPSFKLPLTTLTPNGIFLTQTVGKAIDPDNYKIETVFDDYINVNGIPFILKNGNVLYPAVGNGMVHTDMFYPENYVPQVSGKFLTTLENKLAVFEENKEEMTYVDFQDVEGQLIFFVRGSAMYRIKDYWDLIETPEGIIINLADGIYATNGEKRSLISLPINDIMKKNYLNSSIYYNSYEKEVLYICTKGIYVYRFETDSWSKMDFTGPIQNLTSDNVIDLIDDYLGNMYLVLNDNKIYKIEYKNATGKFGLTYMDLQELAVAKRLNWIALDVTGKVNNNPATTTNTRKVFFFNKMLKDRKPNQWLDFEFTIEQAIKDETPVTGTIYNFEMNFEVFPTRKI